MSFAQGHVPFYRADQIFPEPPVYRFLRESDATPFRIAALDLAAPANAEMPYGLSTPGGYDYSLRRVADLVSPFSDFPRESFSDRCSPSGSHTSRIAGWIS